MTTTPEKLVVTPDEARTQASDLEASVANGDTAVSSVREARDESRSETASYVGTYDPDEAFPGIQVPAQHVGVGLMMRLEQRKQEWAKRAGNIRVAVAELEEMDQDNADNIDKVDTDLDTAAAAPETKPETPETTTTEVRPA